MQVHENIRKNPVAPKKDRKTQEKKRWQPAKLTYEERKANLKKKLAALTEA
jgi:hypothetical protein